MDDKVVENGVTDVHTITPSLALPTSNINSTDSTHESNSSSPTTDTVPSTTITISNDIVASSSTGSKEQIEIEENEKGKAEDKKVIFYGNVLTRHGRLVSLSLSRECIAWQEKGPCSVILSALIGVTTIGKFFTVHYIHNGKKHKTKETHTFKCENDQLPKKWADFIRETQNLDGKGTHGLRAVFVVNPFSGTKKALAVFASVRSLFDIAGIHVTVIETNAAGHAREIGRTIDLTTVDRLVTVSGDGLFNELINGIMDRPDWQEASQLPLGIIPAGTLTSLSLSFADL
jgi:hypothetical protein